MDKARQKTERLLKNLEKRVKAVYANDPQLKMIQREYDKYMEMVANDTKSLYTEYKNAKTDEEKAKCKKAYSDAVKKKTFGSYRYKMIVKKFTRIMADVNQKALDLANAEMNEVYAVNYNQVAVDCREVGIEVNAKEEK